jgi:ATP-dependent Lhr-like helicase
VREGTREIGSLYQTIPVGERFVLNGKTWEVLHVDSNEKTVYVKFVGGKSTINWFSPGFGEVHTKVLQKMREILMSDDEYGYLDQSTSIRLSENRNTMRQTKAFARTHRTDIFQLSQNRFGIFPWLGTRALSALRYSLQMRGINTTDEQGGILSNILLVVLVESVATLETGLCEIKTGSIDTEAFSLPEILEIGKYGEYVPLALVKKQFMDNNVDINEMQREL